MSDADTTERFQGKVGPIFMFSGPPPVTLGFDVECQTVFLGSTESHHGPKSSGGVNIAYVDGLPAGASPCDDFVKCLMALMTERWATEASEATLTVRHKQHSESDRAAIHKHLLGEPRE